MTRKWNRITLKKEEYWRLAVQWQCSLGNNPPPTRVCSIFLHDADHLGRNAKTNESICKYDVNALQRREQSIWDWLISSKKWTWTNPKERKRKKSTIISNNPINHNTAQVGLGQEVIGDARTQANWRNGDTWTAWTRERQWLGGLTNVTNVTNR